MAYIYVLVSIDADPKDYLWTAEDVYACVENGYIRSIESETTDEKEISEKNFLKYLFNEENISIKNTTVHVHKDAELHYAENKLKHLKYSILHMSPEVFLIDGIYLIERIVNDKYNDRVIINNTCMTIDEWMHNMINEDNKDWKIVQMFKYIPNN